MSTLGKVTAVTGVKKLDAGLSSVAPNAMKYSRVGGRRGMASVLDSDNVNTNIEKHQKQLRGAYRMAFLDETNAPLKDVTYNNGERLFRPRADGSFTMIDKQAMEYKKQIQVEVNDYVNSIIEYCIYEDELASEALGFFDVPKYRAELQKDGLAGGCPPSLVSFDATASGLDSVSSTSKEYSGGIAKLRWYIKNVALPIMDGETGTAGIVEKNDEK